MSADSGVYISKFDDGFRVIAAQAIDNLYLHPDASLEQRLMWVNYFKGAHQVHPTIESALYEAKQLMQSLTDEGIPCEYGIQFLPNAPIPSKLLKKKKMP